MTHREQLGRRTGRAETFVSSELSGRGPIRNAAGSPLGTTHGRVAHRHCRHQAIRQHFHGDGLASVALAIEPLGPIDRGHGRAAFDGPQRRLVGCEAAQERVRLDGPAVEAPGCRIAVVCVETDQTRVQGRQQYAARGRCGSARSEPGGAGRGGLIRSTECLRRTLAASLREPSPHKSHSPTSQIQRCAGSTHHLVSAR
jgi:hypothetical protein